MRAHYIRDLLVLDEYELSGDSLHHLMNVVRLEVDEELLLLNGKGLLVETKVTKISKRELRLKKTRHQFRELNYHFELALGMPKRDALELCLKEATELGFKTIYLIKSSRSQMKFPEEERLEKLLISALEQSNAPFLPEVKFQTWEALPWDEATMSFLMDSQSNARPSLNSCPMGMCLLIVGPEGGFSPEEISFFHNKKVLQVVNLPTPILRTPTALAVGTGMMIQSLLK